MSTSDRIALLQAASRRLGGNAALGRALGYRDGAYVGQMLRGDRPITEKTIASMAKVHVLGDLFPPITGQPHVQLDSLNSQDGVTARRQMIDAIAAGHQSPLTLERALSVVLDALADLPPARAASVRAQLDLVREHPEMKGDVLAELLNLLAEPSKGRIAA